jgi:NAD(P)-dependent dehydrogenase (short-subunit alcohol dehydrogenase family)
MASESRVALVTGCGKRDGIGAAVARALSRAGHILVVVDLQPAGVRDAHEPARAADPEWGGLSSLVAELEAAGGKASSATGDISNEADVARIVGHAIETYGRLDVLVNNAGAPLSLGHGDVEAVTADDWDRVFAINVRGTFLMCRAAAPHMRRQNWGRIINIASIAGRTGSKANSTYAASKAAVIGLSHSMALDLGPAHVTVNAILPGFILTSRSLSGMSKRLGQADIDDATIAKSTPVVPLGRAGTPDDIAGTVAFLASDAAAYTTGQSFVIDGGSYRL